MRKGLIAGGVLLLAILAGFAPAGSGTAVEMTAPTSDPESPAQGRARTGLYPGLYGSNDYVRARDQLELEADPGGWTLWGSPPEPAMDRLLVATDRHQYIIGGYAGVPLYSLYRNDLESRAWVRLADMPVSLTNCGAAWVGDTVYVVGGYSYASNTMMDTVAKYSISGDNWVTGPGPFDDAGFNWMPCVVAADGKVFRMGGCAEPGATDPTNSCHAYTPGEGWTRVGDMHEGRVFSHAWNHNDTIWVTTGFGSGDQRVTRASEFMCARSGIWARDQSIFPDFPNDDNGGVYSAGGFSPPGTGVGIVYGGTNAHHRSSDWVYEFFHWDRAWRPRYPAPAQGYRGAGLGNARHEALFFTGSSIHFKTFPALADYHDVGVKRILVPAEPRLGRGDTLRPTVVVANYGTGSHPDVLVHFKVFPLGSPHPVYHARRLVALPVGTESLEVSFPEWRLPDELWRSFDVTAFTDLRGDVRPENDTQRMTCIITSDTLYSNAAAGLPVIDGFIAPGEWDDAYFVDVSAVGWGRRAPTEPAHAWFKHCFDPAKDNWYACYAFALPGVTDRKVGDQVGLYIDVNGDGEWPEPGNHSEGNYWFVVNAREEVEVQYRPWTRAGARDPNIAPGAEAAAGTRNGYLVFEGRIPFGTLPWELDMDPDGHVAGLFLYLLTDSHFPAWWPLDIERWNDPAHYGRYELILPTAIAERPEPPAAFTLSRVAPNPFTGSAYFRLDLPQAQRVRIRLYDPAGRQVRTIADRTMAAGNHRLRLDAGGLPRGTYLLRVETGDSPGTPGRHTAIQKLVLRR